MSYFYGKVTPSEAIAEIVKYWGSEVMRCVNEGDGKHVYIRIENDGEVVLCPVSKQDS